MRVLFILALLFQTYISINAIGYSERLTIGPQYFTVSYDASTGQYITTGSPDVIAPNTNARAAIQQALDKISNDGGVIYLPDVLYTIDNQINIFSKTELRGAGIDSTTIKLVDYAAEFSYAGLVRGFPATNNIKISQITVDGNKQKQNPGPNYGRYGIYTESVTNAWFDYVRVINFEEYGFDPHGKKWTNSVGVYDGIWANYLTITNCISEYNDKDGFTLDMTHHIYMENCLAQYNGRHGYNVVTGSTNTIIKKSVSQYNGMLEPNACGMTAQNNMLLGTNNMEFTDNIIRGNGDISSGICIDDVYTVKLDGNRITGHKYCINVQTGRNIIIENTECIAQYIMKTYDPIITITDRATVGIYVDPDNNIFKFPNGRLIPYSTLVPTTRAPTTVSPTTAVPTSLPPATVPPRTDVPTSLPPATVPPRTDVPTTPVPTTVAPPTPAPTTIAPTTIAPTTIAPPTVAPTTLALTTVAPTTVAPTTPVPTTPVPTTVAPTTPVPTTIVPTTIAPTTIAPTTPVPTTIAPSEIPTGVPTIVIPIINITTIRPPITNISTTSPPLANITTTPPKTSGNMREYNMPKVIYSISWSIMIMILI